MTDLNKDLLKEALKCVKCGACLAVCPIYKELLTEQNSPRGRSALGEEVGSKDLELTQKLVDIFTKCLTCGACEAVCTKGVPVTKIIYEMREMLYEKRRYDKAIHMIIRLMYNSPQLFSIVLKNAAFFKPVIFEEKGENGLLKPRISLPFLKSSRTIPNIKGKFFLDSAFDKVDTKKPHIALFPGCIFNYLYPDIAKKSLNILKGLGKIVHVTDEQFCCGYPALSVGDMHNLKDNILKNIDILNETHPERIVVLCSSCSLMFKKYYPMIFEEDSEHIQDKVRKFSAKVIDFAVYLREHKDELFKFYGKKEPLKATYHIPCHLNYGLKAGNVIKEIFSGMENIQLIDPENPEMCCGYGGVFNMKYPDLSMKISDRKVYDILNTKADVVLTSCSGCIMQLSEALSRHDSKVKVKHISEIILS
jgi:glycolate oxidase iron-sulfur subunit